MLSVSVKKSSSRSFGFYVENFVFSEKKSMETYELTDLTLVIWVKGLGSPGQAFNKLRKAFLRGLTSASKVGAGNLRSLL